MRTHFPALLAALAALAIAAPASGATRNFGITSFERIRVDGPYKVRLTTGVAPFASASGSNAAIDRVAIDVQGSTLVVHANRSSWGGFPNETGGAAEIIIGTHDLKAAWLNGSGSLTISAVKGLNFDLSAQGSGSVAIDRADVDHFRIHLYGTAAGTVAGRAGKLTALIRGVSSLDASGLTSKDATIGAEGPATVKAAVTNAAKITASGAATITLTGSPACTAKLSGSASVSGCGSGAN